MVRIPAWCGWLLVAGLLACYPLSGVLPAYLAREDGLFENLQVLVLGAGCLLAVAMYMRTRQSRLSALALLAAPVWLLLAGREVSWGKAWIRQPGIDGVLAAPAWLPPLLWPAATALVVWFVSTAWCMRLDALVRAAFVQRAPWLFLGVALAGAMGSTCAEGHMSCSLDMAAGPSQVFEELVELIAYLALCTLQAAIFHYHAAHVRPVPAVLPVDAGVEEPG